MHGSDPGEADEGLVAHPPTSSGERDAADGQPNHVPDDAAREVGVSVPEVEPRGDEDGEGGGGGLGPVESGLAGGEVHLSEFDRVESGPGGDGDE